MKHAAFHLSFSRITSDPNGVSLRRARLKDPLMGARLLFGGLAQCVQCHTSRTSVLVFGRGGLSAHTDRPIDLSLKVVPNGSSPATRYVKTNTVAHGVLQGMIEANSTE